MYESFQSPNYFLMIFIALASAVLVVSPFFKQSVRERIWHWGRGENSLRFALAFLSFILSFMLGSAYLASLFPELSSCTTTYSSSISITSSTTIETNTGTMQIGTPVPPLFEGSATASSSECLNTNSLNHHIENWLKMMLPPMARYTVCFTDDTSCSPLQDAYMASSLNIPANSLEAYIALWGTSLASAFLSFYMTAYLLRDARKRKVEE